MPKKSYVRSKQRAKMGTRPDKVTLSVEPAEGYFRTHSAFKFALDPTPEQIEQLKVLLGQTLWTYNWALGVRKRTYEETQIDLSFEQLSLKFSSEAKAQHEWLYEGAAIAQIAAIRDVSDAYKRFFKGQNKYPKFKHRGDKQRFRVSGQGVYVLSDYMIVIPKVGHIKTKESTAKIRGRIVSATICKEADKWYCSFNTAYDRPIPHPNPVVSADSIVGIDLGLCTFAVIANAEGKILAEVEAPKPLAKLLTLLKKRHKQLDRKTIGSKRREKAKIVLQRLYRRIARVRQEFLSRLTTELAKTKAGIGIEDLNVSGWMKLKNIARDTLDSGFGILIRKLKYKCSWADEKEAHQGWYGAQLVIADRYYPSSQICSSCGNREGNQLTKREFKCNKCGLTKNRDHNAAINLAKLAKASLEAAGNSSVRYTRGDGRLGMSSDI